MVPNNGQLFFQKIIHHVLSLLSTPVQAGFLVFDPLSVSPNSAKQKPPFCCDAERRFLRAASFYKAYFSYCCKSVAANKS
jgi:hypothetical protein